MEYAIIGLLLLGIGILVYSFYKEKDQAVQLEEKMENLSIQILKEIHQIQSTLVSQGNNKLGENRRSKESLKEKKEGA
ncbi:hypothetical protein P4S93_09900 [Aneurinibacillus thermoaerophilus]|uniref:hypothetical protein n=1 Tax=Aneurinibacillus thermoaerophilus TaxID=143495 RepID=UPI002E1A62D4|nr:hypothetical protein [Aneurinibacillus thermoaerophilus]MED0761084.1 hypothetical protein [Aneurinibacillus thermoaerophilus]